VEGADGDVVSVWREEGGYDGDYLAEAADQSEENFLGLAEGKFHGAEATIGDMTTGVQIWGYKIKPGISGILLIWN
jgi:hypothetical protein